jgi:glycosyltransferase involved in cell wall biosynthesis
MRIAIVTETAPPNVNGIVTRLGHTLRELRARGDEVMVAAPSTAPAEWEGVPVMRVSSFPLPNYPELQVGLPRPALRDALIRFRPDVVHVVNPVVLGAGALVYARVAGLPVVASFHTHMPRYLSHYGLGPLEDLAWEYLRTVHNQAAVNLCISTPMAAELRLRGFERVEVGWRGGVDTRLFHPGQAALAMRERLTDGHPQRPLILYAGRVSAEKNVDLLGPITACLPGAHLAIVGDGPRRAALGETLKGRAATFLGYLRGTELASAMASADVLVFPSATETLGLVALEAMAAGTPVVAAAAGGIPDLVEHEHNGLLFPPGDAAAAAAGIRRLLHNRLELELMRVRGRRFADAWSRPAATADLRRHYEAVLEPTERRAA